MARDYDSLVFSTDRSHLALCPVCGGDPCACTAPAEVAPALTVLRLRLEKRRGKAVTVVFDLPPHPAYWGGLVKKLKVHCGSGGALKDDGMEFQGDQREKVEQYLAKLGFTVKRAGG